MASEVNSPDTFPYSLLAPGPVNIHPEVRKALALPMIHHRTPEFDQILKKVLQGIKIVFQTKEDVFLMTSTGSGGMEALLVNVLSPGDKVIAIVSGKFGERWADMAKVFGTEVITHNVPWGEAVKVSDVQDLLRQHPTTRAVLCQACETSTAVAHPIHELAAVIHKMPETLFLVDAITALGAYPLPMDEWHIDGLVAGSQKAFMLPTGMSFISFSQKAWKYVENAKCFRYYLDIRKEKKDQHAGETIFYSNVSCIVLEMVEKQGLQMLFDGIQSRARFTRHFGQALGLILYATSPSDSVTALMLPPTIDGQKVRLHLEEKYNITIMGGQDQAKGKIIRVGHMGYIQDEEMLRLIECLGKTLQHFDKHFLSEEKLTKVVRDAHVALEKL
jgi:aspartate aminotransferase-like enzyme